jgi:hypothetical protein
LPLGSAAGNEYADENHDDDDGDDDWDECTFTYLARMKVALFVLADSIGQGAIGAIEAHSSAAMLTMCCFSTARLSTVGGPYTYDYTTTWPKIRTFVHDTLTGRANLFRGMQWGVLAHLTDAILTWGGPGLPLMLRSLMNPDAPPLDQKWHARSRLLADVCGVVPKVLCQALFVREIVDANSEGEDSVGGVLASIPLSFFASRLWTCMWDYMRIGDRLISLAFGDEELPPPDPGSFSFDDFCEWNDIKYLLPWKHPLRETRSWTECWAATRWYTPKLAGLLLQTPLPDFSFNLWVNWSLMKYYGLCCLVGYGYGTVIGYPVKRAYTFARNALANQVFESNEARLSRKLQHASTHIQQAKARVFRPEEVAVASVASTEDTSNYGSDSNSKVPLRRQNTFRRKQEAVSSGFKEKQHALFQRIVEYARQSCNAGVSCLQTDLVLGVNRQLLGCSIFNLAFSDVLPMLYGRVRVVYQGEEGVDAGGVFREWADGCAALLHSNQPPGAEKELEKMRDEAVVEDIVASLLEPSPDGSLLPRACPKDAFTDMRHMILFAIGRFMALAITQVNPVNLPLSRCLYKVLMGEAISPDDVKRIDPSFFKHRVEAVMKEGGVAEMEAVLCDDLFFVGVPIEGEETSDPVELCENGRTRKVTEKNKREYVRLLVEHYLIGHCREEVAFIMEGFYDVLPRKVLHGVSDGDAYVVAKDCRLTALDLELLVTGMPDIDVTDWRQHCRGGLTTEPQHEALREWWWEVLADMDLERRAKLLAFACGNSRLPAGGFASLRPPFCVEVVGAPTSHLPSAHTCFNMLELPNYTSKEELAERVSKALDVDAGFGFI